MYDDAPLDHWVLTGTDFLGTDVAGLRLPNEAVALLIDGYSTDDGRHFEAAPFGAGTPSVTMVVLPAEAGEKIYARLASYIGSKKSKKENLLEENEVLAAKWDLEDGSVAVMAADGGNGEFAQDTLEGYMRLERLPLHSSGAAVIARQMDATILLEKGEVVLGDRAREVLLSLRLPESAPSPARPPRP